MEYCLLIEKLPQFVFEEWFRHFCLQSACDHLATEIDDLSDDLHSYPPIIQHNLGSDWPVKFND